MYYRTRGFVEMRGRTHVSADTTLGKNLKYHCERRVYKVRDIEMYQLLFYTIFFCIDVKNYIWSLERNIKWRGAWKKSAEQNGRRKTCPTAKCSDSLKTCR